MDAAAFAAILTQDRAGALSARSMAEGESEHDGALKRYVAKVQEHREFESRVKKLRETATWKQN